jgi:hypothetical protein
VGPSGEEIHVDEWGRIKVRFLFTRNEDNTMMVVQARMTMIPIRLGSMY